jgi:hypothetical protein
MAFRTKKISQMDPKGSNLASTDLLEISQLVSGSYITKSITGAEIISGATTGFVPTTRTLTINGTTQDLSANRTFTVSTGITIGTTAITSGTVGRVLFEGTGNVVQESANLFWDNTNGRLGIGTSSPISKLHIVGDTNIIYQQASTTGFTGKLYYAFKSGGVSGEAMSLFGDFVAGVASAFAFSNASGTTVMQIRNGGNVQIGTTTDAGYKLDVNGTARVVNQATIQTLTVGLGGGAVSTNTAIGVSSLLSNTTGFDNSSFGWESLKSVTTGLFNSAFGVQALRSFVTGAHNSAFGNCALFSATGSRNSSLGSCAFYSLSSGNDNTSLGNNSGRYIAGGATANTTCNTSIFIGSDTKALANSQTNQIVIGYNETGIGSNTTIIGNSSTTLTALRGSLLLGTTTDVASSIATLESTTKGFLCPRMTTTQKNAIASPATGLMVYDTTLNLISVYNGTTWITL